jgi:ribokinase
LDGGKGSNQAFALSRLGARTSLIAVIGDDEEGRFFLEYFSKQNVDLTYVTVCRSCSTGKGIAFMDYEGIPMGVTLLGAISEMTSEHIQKALPIIRSSSVLLTQLEIPVDLALYACRLGKKNGLLTILNPAPSDSLVGIKIENVDVLTPNEPEAKLLAGFRPEADVSIDDLAKILWAQTDVTTIVITLGENGAIIVDSAGVRKIPCPKVKAVDTSGAGDCFNAALAFALGNNWTIDLAVDFAVKTASMSVGKQEVWPSFPTLEEVFVTYGAFANTKNSEENS